jgi:hypothetical protein
MSRSYRIWSPKYTHRSGGIRAIHRLAGILRERGYEATINDPPMGFNYVAVYPEMITEENPFGAKNIVYYLCNLPGLLGGIKEYPAGSLKVWYGAFLSPPGGAMLLTIPTIELDLFNTKGAGRRIYNTSWVGKAKMLGIFKGIPVGNRHITYRWPEKRQDVANLLKTSRILYCYDGLTALTMEAALCGCPAIIMEQGPWKKEIVEKNEFGTAGIGWGMQELRKAKQTLPQALPNYLNVEANLPRQVEAFIEATQNM